MFYFCVFSLKKIGKSNVYNMRTNIVSGCRVNYDLCKLRLRKGFRNGTRYVSSKLFALEDIIKTELLCKQQTVCT